jgi:hypothetical protein
MKLLEVLLTDSGVVTITIGNVPTGQFTIPIVETGIKERELPKHMGITLSSENTEGRICACRGVIEPLSIICGIMRVRMTVVNASKPKGDLVLH